jgi:hypothetical protein
MLALFAVLAVAPSAAIPVPVLVAADLEAGTVVHCRPAHGEVTLAYTHSMYGGEVRERFGASQDGRVWRLEMTTANAAAAEYYAYDARVERDGDRYRVDVPEQAFPEVVVRVDRIGDHRLLLGEQTVDLVAAVGEGRPVALRVQSVSLLDRLLPGGC